MLFDNLVVLCKNRGITLAKLERELEFGNGAIRKWNRSYPSADKVQKVADYFGITTDELLGRNTNKLSEEGKRLAVLFDSLPADKQDLVRRYISVVCPN